ncbi:hypothetical protein GQ600_16848 [Phytophthora cactorum]|nr:hypothetical protein GQ600_16848 [Phytophthora cactorum]
MKVINGKTYIDSWIYRVTLRVDSENAVRFAQFAAVFALIVRNNPTNVQVYLQAISPNRLAVLSHFGTPASCGRNRPAVNVEALVKRLVDKPASAINWSILRAQVSTDEDGQETELNHVGKIKPPPLVAVESATGTSSTKSWRK